MGAASEVGEWIGEALGFGISEVRPGPVYSSVSHSLIICSFRAKYHKLKFGTDPNQGEKKQELSEQGTHPQILPTHPPNKTECAEVPTWAASFSVGSIESITDQRAGEVLISHSVPFPAGCAARYYAGPWGEMGGWIVVKKASLACCHSEIEIDTQGPL